MDLSTTLSYNLPRVTREAAEQKSALDMIVATIDDIVGNVMTDLAAVANPLYLSTTLPAASEELLGQMVNYISGTVVSGSIVVSGAVSSVKMCVVSGATGGVYSYGWKTLNFV
jgi:hypothetical protein